MISNISRQTVIGDRGDQLRGRDERHQVRHQELPLGVRAGDGSDGLDPGEHAGGAEQQVSGHHSRYRGGGALLREPLLNSHYIYLENNNYERLSIIIFTSHINCSLDFIFQP